MVKTCPRCKGETRDGSNELFKYNNSKSYAELIDQLQDAIIFCVENIKANQERRPRLVREII